MGWVLCFRFKMLDCESADERGKSRKVAVMMQYDSALSCYYAAAALLTEDKISERTDHAALPPFPVTKPWMSVSTKWCSVHFGCFALHPLVLPRLLVYEITDVLSASSRPERVEVLLGSCITTAMKQLGVGARKSASGCVYGESLLTATTVLSRVTEGQ